VHVAGHERRAVEARGVVVGVREDLVPGRGHDAGQPRTMSSRYGTVFVPASSSAGVSIAA
jgi:hypothetical protein